MPTWLQSLIPSFTEPSILWGLFLVPLPIIIHLINQHRHRTMHWGAMMFLLQAKRMTRGMAKLRHWLIMLARMLAIAGLVFAISRPQASGFLGRVFGGAPETTIVLLDRSASMEQQDLETGISKRSAAITKLTEVLTKTSQGTNLILIESTRNTPEEVGSPAVLADMVNTAPSSTAADIPGMLQKAVDYMTANETGRTDIWVCSDLRANDWDADGGRWEALRSSIAEKSGVKVFLLTYPDTAPDNISVTVSNVHRRQINNAAELVMDIHLRRDTQDAGDPIKVPLQFVIDGARSSHEVEMSGPEYDERGYVMSIDTQMRSGYGRIELPGDSNMQDNVFHFVYSEPPLHQTVIVSDDKEAQELLALAAGTPSVNTIEYRANVYTSNRVDEIPWDETAMILWQAPIPDGLAAKQLQNFVKAGKTVVFFPPDTVGGNEIFSASWGNWETAENKQPIRIAGWRSESDLLGRTQGGDSLPVGELQTFQYCSLKGDEFSELASLDGGDVLLARSTVTQAGGVYFMSTLPKSSHSTLSTNGVVLYVMLQRALSAGAASLGQARQAGAGLESEALFAGAANPKGWAAADETTTATVSERAVHSGAWRNEDRLLALNRPEKEDHAAVLPADKLDAILDGVDYQRIDDSAENEKSLISDLWRMFLVIMAVALILEALLCLPEKRLAKAE